MMRKCDPYHLALVSAIEYGEFERASEILKSKTANKYICPVGALEVTALQVAAWQGRIDLLDQLHEKGANVNDVDKIGRCALYYAADCGHANVAEWLLQRGADIDAKVGIFSCTKEIPMYSLLSKPYYIGKNLPLPVCWGRSPLHQAVKNNHADVVRILVNGGADVNVKDQNQITPLLLAGSAVNHDDLNEMAKFAEIVKILIFAKAFVDIIHPDTGATALHHATMLGSAEATRILLSNNAWPMYKCNSSGSTPLHIAASIGSTEILNALLEVIPPYSVDVCDNINRTPLHRASYQGHRECVRVLLKHGASLAAVTKTGVTAINAICSYIPRPLVFLMEILDSCVWTNNHSLENYENITVDFTILAPKHHMQMAVVTAIIGATSDISQLAILQHPLVETFLRLKWSKLRTFFFLLVIVHFSFVSSLSIYAMTFLRNGTDLIVVNRRILEICSCILLFHNMIQVLLEPKHYLRQLETWLSVICAIISLITSITGEFTKCSKEELESRRCAHWVLHSISIAILLSWMQMMLLIGRFPMWGYYALMFSTVLKNILKVLLAFGYLIIGFALSFSVLFHGNQEFREFWRAIVRTVIMMMGEYDYENLFNNEESKNTFLPITSRIVFFVFTMLASIVLINLMIGLAVNDIQGIEKEGHIRRLLKQAEFVAHLERVMSHRIFRSNWLHPRIRKLLHSRRDIPTKIKLAPRENYFNHMSHHKELFPKILVDLVEPLHTLATKTFFKNDNMAYKNTEIDNTKLIAMLSNLEEQIRDLKQRGYKVKTQNSVQKTL